MAKRRRSEGACGAGAASGTASRAALDVRGREQGGSGRRRARREKEDQSHTAARRKTIRRVAVAGLKVGFNSALTARAVYKVSGHVTVIKQSLVEEVVDVKVPPSDLLDDLGKLMEAGEGADLMIDVQGEIFHAHKFMLAIRSPVFKAELYGPVGEKDMMHSFTIVGMEPGLFKALLHFIYTDSCPAMHDPDGNVSEETIRKLLVAADRYDLERMKSICEDILCKRLDIKNVAATLAFADQQSCRKLKDTCMEFIKRVCPDVFIDIWEKDAKSCKIKTAATVTLVGSP
ncbi:hypothetical protein EJB05_08402, partial [Eragrostis curvula]